MKKRIAAFLLAVCMLAAMIPATATAVEAGEVVESGSCGDNAQWTFYSDGRLVISGTGAIDDYGRIDEDGDYRQFITPWSTLAVTSVVVEDGITHIGFAAFMGQPGVFSVEIGDGVTSIGMIAFRNCRNLAQVTFGSGLTSIGADAFTNCPKLTEVELPDSLIEIGAGSFSNCAALTTVNISDSVTTVGERAFANCTSLTNVTIGDGLTALSKEMFSGCSALTTIDLNRATSIGERSFFGCTGLEKLNLPDTVQTIGREAFQNCTGLVRVTVGRGVQEIPPYCFTACTALTSVTFKADGVRIKLNAFYACSQLKTVTAPSKIDVSDGGAFYGCSSLVSVPTVSGPVGGGSFGSCSSLPSVTLGDDVTSIDMAAFQYCTSLTSVTLPDSVTVVENSAFRECSSLTWVELGTGVTALRDYCFYKVDDDCTLLFRGDAPETGSYTLYSVDRVLFYLGREGWTAPKWRNKPSYPVNQWEYIMQSDYYTKPYLYSFFFETADGEKLDQATVAIGGEEFFSEDQSYLSVRVAALDEGDTVRISREGYDTVSLPAALLSSYQYIRLYPVGSEDPTLRVLYAEKNHSGEYIDLYRTPLYLTEKSPNEQVALYVDVDWGTHGTGSIYLSQSKDPAEGILLQNGWNEAQNLSTRLHRCSGLYLLMVAGDGTVYSQWVSVSVLSASSTYVKTDFAPEVSIPSPDLEVIREMDLDLQMLENAKISMTFRTDGTFVAVLGIEVAKEEYIYGVAQEVKEALDGYGSVQSLMGGLLLDGRSFGSTHSPSKLAIDMSSSVVGYMEGKAVTFGDGSTGLIATECKVGLLMEGEVVMRMEYPVWGVPVYLELSAEGKGEVTVNMNVQNASSALQPVSGSLNAEIALGMEAGLGWDKIAAAGVQGVVTFTSELDLPASRQTIQDDYRLYANGAWKLNAEFLCLEASVELAKTRDHYIYGHPKGETFQMAALPADDGAAELVWQPQSRDYLNAAAPMAADGGSGENVVAGGVYPYADVQLAVLKSGTRLLVWSADPGTRVEDNNRTVLYYSYHDGAAWSAPAPVEGTDDGTADFAPVLQVLDGTAYLVWQDAARALTAEDTADAMAGALDLSCAVFDPAVRAFTALGTVGTEHYDGTPSLTLLDGSPALVWTANSGGPLNSDGRLTTLHRGVWDGAAWQTEVLGSELGAVDQTAADGPLVWFSADTDYDGSTLEDREIFFYDGGEVQRLTDNDVVDSKPELSRGTVSWYSDGKLVLGSETISLAASTDRYQYLRSSGGLEAMVYVVTDGATGLSALYAGFHDGAGWGEPICIDGGNGNIGSFSARFCSDGTLAVAVRERSVAGSELSAAAQIKVYTVTPFCDLVLEQVDYKAHSLVSGGTLGVQLNVRNAGMTAINFVQVVVKSGSEVLLDGVYELELLSGQSGGLMAAVPLGKTVPGELTVEVSPVGGTDSAPENNTASLTLRLQDISLEETEARCDGVSTEVTVLAVNRGQQDFSGVTLTLKDRAGAVLDRMENFSLSAGESCFVTFTLDRAFEHNTILTIEAAGLAEENLYANNSADAVVTAIAGEQAGITVAYAGTDTGLTVSVQLKPLSAEIGGYTLCCAAYDREGRMVAVQTQPGSADGSHQFDFEASAEEIFTVRVFVLNGEHRPLMSHAEVNVI